MNWIVENWEFIAGAVSAPIAYFFGGKMKQKTDAIVTMQTIYDSFLDDYKLKMSDVMQELKNVKDHHKELQKQFNEIYLQYAKEVEVSQNWEKLHREIKEKYESLKNDHEKLKEEFKQYKYEHR
jgi:septation ring formation regulator EzrA